MLFTVSGHIRNSIYTQQKQENMTTITASGKMHIENLMLLSSIKFIIMVIIEVVILLSEVGSYILT